LCMCVRVCMCEDQCLIRVRTYLYVSACVRACLCV
jgi:hypothetical protein